MSGIKHQLSATGAALSKAVAAKAEDAFVSEIHKMVHHMLHSPLFENLLSLVIMLNFGVIVIETDTVAQERETPLWMDASSIVVLVMFVAELAGRIYVERKQFFSDYWNIFDFCIVSFDASLSLLDALIGSYFPASVLRIFRLCKVARVSKIFRVFPELRLMMAGMMGALSAIFWGGLLLGFGLLVWSILAVQFIRPLAQELAKQGVYEGCERCGRSFDTVMGSVLTLVQQTVAGDSWGTVTIPIIEHYPVSALYFASVFLTIGMAILNLMLAVCVDVATRARESLKTEMVQEELLTKETKSTELIQICKEMDSDNSGELTKQELVHGYDENPAFQVILAELEIAREDLEIVWLILDSDKSGLVSYAEFIAQLLTMRSSDSQFMLAYIRYYVTVIRVNMDEQMTELQTEVRKTIIQTEQLQVQTKEEGKVENDKLDKLLYTIGNGTVPLSPKPNEYNSEGNPRSEMLVNPAFEGTPAREAKERSTEMKNLEDIVNELHGHRTELTEVLKEVRNLRDSPGRPVLSDGPGRPVFCDGPGRLVQPVDQFNRNEKLSFWPCSLNMAGEKQVLTTGPQVLKLLSVPEQVAASRG